MTPIFALTITLFIFVAAQVFFEYRHHHGQKGPWVGITKTIGSLLFVVIGIAAQVHHQSGGLFFLIGITLCVLGDVFLISQKRILFLLGLISFLLAHMAYCFGFLSTSPILHVVLAALPVVFAVGFLIARWVLPHVDSKMKLPVIAYIVTICTMVSLSAGCFPTAPHLALAAVLFMISDVFVARDRFVTTTFVNRLWGLPLYYTAQVLFAASAALARY